MNRGPKRLTLLPLLALIAALMFALTGCGGDDGEENATTPASSGEATTAVEADVDEGEGADQSDANGQSDFVAAVTKVCDSTRTEASKVGFDDEFEEDPAEDPEAFAAELSDRWNRAKKVFDDAFAQLREIPAPDGKGDDYDRFLTINERIMALNTAQMDAFAEDPTFTMSESDMKKLQKLTEEQESLMDSVGIPEDCFDSEAP